MRLLASSNTRNHPAIAGEHKSRTAAHQHPGQKLRAKEAQLCAQKDFYDSQK